MSPTTTCAPSAANASDIARPSPDEPPVTTIVLPVEPQLRSPLASPPSISTVMPLMYAARVEQRKATASPISAGSPNRRAGISALVARAVAGGVVAHRVDVLHPVGVDVARRDRVDGDAVRALVLRQRLRPAGHAGPVDVRQQQSLVRLLDGGRGDVDDPTAAALAQLGQRQPCQAERRHQRQLPGRAPALVVEVLEPAGGRPAGVVDDDVDLAEPLERAVDGRTQRVGSVESPATASARAPEPRPSISATASSSSSCRRANSVTLQPSRASDSAAARPMPDEDPETMATHPARPRSMELLTSSRRL